jgi:transposase
MKAVHGGKVKNDKIDSHKIAGLLRGGMFPMAYVYPPEMRATRDLLRRRCFLVRRRADLLGHVHSTAIQYNLPEIGVRLTYEGPRSTVPDHFPDPEVRKIVQIDLAMIDAYDDVIGALEWELEKTSRRHDRRTLMLLSSIHGIGRILSMVLLYEIHDINRFESVQDFASYCRLVKCPHESAGKKKGTGGAKIGNAHLKWAFSEAAVSFLRHNAPGKLLVEQLAKKHGKGKALSILAHKLARAIYYMLKNSVPFNLEKFMATA